MFNNNNSHNCCCCHDYKFFFFIINKYTYQPRWRHLSIDKVSEECGNFCFFSHTHCIDGGWKNSFTLIFMFFSPRLFLLFITLHRRWLEWKFSRYRKLQSKSSFVPLSVQKEGRFLSTPFCSPWKWKFFFQPCDIDFSRMLFKKKSALCSQED